MPTISNMGDVYYLVDLYTTARNLTKEASFWIRSRFPREAASRTEWHDLQGPFAHLGLESWGWLEGVSSNEERQRYEAIRQVTSKHVAKAIEKGERLVAFQSDGYELAQVTDWLAALPTEDPLLFSKLPKVSWHQALEHSRRWHEKLAKRQEEAISADEMAEGTEAVLDFDDGWRWVRLTTEIALDREGQAMGHCVGSGGYDTFAVKATWPDGIFSLRDQNGRPHVTIEVQNTDIVQVQGRGNSKPKGYADKLKMLTDSCRLNLDTPGALGLARVNDVLMTVDEALKVLAEGPVKGTVDLSHSDVTTVPQGTSVSGGMDLSGCLSLVRLPHGLEVGGSLYLENCPALTELPDALMVGGSMHLEECTSLTYLPIDMEVAGGIYGADHLPLRHIGFKL